MTAAEDYLEARLNAAVEELESARAERDALRARCLSSETKLEQASAELFELRGLVARPVRCVSPPVSYAINHRLEALGVPISDVEDMAADKTEDYTARDLETLAAFGAGVEWAQGRHVPGKALRLFVTEVSNARQALANGADK